MSKQNPFEALNEFYNLKNKYESGYYEKYVKPIIKNAKLSKKEKRAEYAKLPKAECINCKRNVETYFSIRNDNKESLRKFVIKCGDVNDPCPLDIEINLSQRDSLSKLIDEGLKSIENIKLQIIKEKNNAIFFNKDVVSVFETLTSNLKEETNTTGSIIETNLLRNNNPEKRKLLNRTIDEFSKGFLLPFKQMISKYNETNNELIINNAVKFYVDEMVPKLNDIMELRYDVNMIEHDELTNTYRLIQMPNSIESMTFSISSDDKVVKFVKGLKEKIKSKSKTITKKTKTKTGTKKDVTLKQPIQKPSEERLIIEEDSSLEL